MGVHCEKRFHEVFMQRLMRNHVMSIRFYTKSAGIVLNNLKANRHGFVDSHKS